MLELAVMNRRDSKPQGVAIGRKVESMRTSLGMTRKTLAELASLTENYIYRLESGKHPYPSPSTLVKLAAAFGITVEELVGSPAEPTSIHKEDWAERGIGELAPNTPPEKMRRYMTFIDALNPIEQDRLMLIVESFYRSSPGQKDDQAAEQ